MSVWTHSICIQCWIDKNPGHAPHHVYPAECDVCCFCGRETTDGIYVREDPNTTPCKGKHKGANDETKI